MQMQICVLCVDMFDTLFMLFYAYVSFGGLFTRIIRCFYPTGLLATFVFSHCGS